MQNRIIARNNNRYKKNFQDFPTFFAEMLLFYV